MMLPTKVTALAWPCRQAQACTLTLILVSIFLFQHSICCTLAKTFTPKSAATIFLLKRQNPRSPKGTCWQRSASTIRLLIFGSAITLQIFLIWFFNLEAGCGKHKFLRTNLYMILKTFAAV